jgi:hypothetical protein
MAGLTRSLGQLAVFGIGVAIGGPTGGAIANTLFNILVPPVNAYPATRIDDLLRQGVSIGDTITKHYGVMPGTLGLIDCGYDDKGVAAAIEEVATTKKKGGIFGLGAKKVTTYEYFLTGAFIVGEGIVYVDQITMTDSDGDKIIYDRWNDGQPEPRSFEFRDLWKLIAKGAHAYITGQGYELTPVFDGGKMIAEISEELRLYPGTERQQIDSKLAEIHGENAVPYRGTGFVMFNHMKINGTPQFKILARGETDDIREIIIERFTGVGVPLSRIKIESLSGRIHGMAIAQIENARNAVDKLAALYFCDISFLNGAFRDLSRLNPFTWYLKKGEQGAYVVDDKGDFPSKRDITVKNEKSFPSSLTLSFIDPAENYEKNEAVSYRSSALFENPITIDYPFAIEFEDAQRLCDVMLDELWADEGTEKISLLPEHAQIAQGNVIVYEDATGTRAIRVGTQENGTKTALDQTGTKYDPTVYGIQKLITNTAKPRPTAPVYLTPVYYIGDLPALHADTRAALGVWVGAGTQEGARWDGAMLVSTELGLDEELVESAMIGQLVGSYTFTEKEWRVWNEEMVIRVQLLTKGTFSSASESQLADNGNLTALGNMVFSYRTAIPVSEGVYDLEGILPGRFGSDWQAGQVFAEGTKVARITDENGDDLGLEWFEIPSSSSGQNKAVELYAAQAPAKTTGNVAFTPNGYALKPLRPEIGRDRSETGDVTFYIWPRTRDFDGSAKALSSGQSQVETDGKAATLELLNGDAVVSSASYGQGELPITATFTAAQLEGFYGAGNVPAKIKGTVRMGANGFPRSFEL